jgi:type II secretory pathway component GspD/PulD (secretin)
MPRYTTIRRLSVLACAIGLVLSLATSGAQQQSPPAKPSAQAPQGTAQPPLTLADEMARDAAMPERDPKKAKQAFLAGDHAAKQEDWQTAVESFAEAVRLQPDKAEYKTQWTIAVGKLVRQHIDRAERDAASNKIEDARSELQTAIILDPFNSVVRERLSQMNLPTTTRMEPVFDEFAGAIHLLAKPGTQNLDLKGDTKAAYSRVAEQFGLQVAFDPDLNSRPVRFRAEGVDFATAMDILGEQTGTFWRPLTERLFFVAANTADKRKNYDASIVRTVLLPGSATTAEMTDLTRLIRDVTGVTRTQLAANSRTLTLRGSPSAVALAYHVIEGLEQPRAEVNLEFEILSVDRTLARDLGITPPTSITAYDITKQDIQEAETSAEGLVGVISQIFGLSASMSSLSTSQLAGLVGEGSLSAASLLPPLIAFGGGQSTFLATLPGAVANFSESLSLVRSGQRILIRAQDGQPATFFVGERYPVTLGQYSSSLGTSTNIPAISTSSFPTSNYSTGASPVAVATGHFDSNNSADGFDLAVVNQIDGTVTILLNSGTGTFTSTAGNPPGVGSQPSAIVTGTFDTNSATETTDLAVANYNCTGSPLVCGPGTLSILLGNGDGTFTTAPTPPTTGHGPIALATGQFNLKNAADHTDLAVVNQQDNTVSILLANGDGTFTQANSSPIGVGHAPSGVAVADFNGDGYPDLAVTNQNDNSVSILLGNGDGTFRAGVVIVPGNGPIATATADFNNDGFQDLAVVNNSDNTVAVFLGNGDGTFAAPGTFPTGVSPVSLVVGDFNQDGLEDMVVVNQSDSTISLLVNASGGQFSLPLDLGVGSEPAGITSADFNGDGLPDVAVADKDANTVTVVLDSTLATTGETSATSGLTPFPGAEYVDLGAKIKATPRIHPDGDVSVKLSIELRALAGQSVNSIPVLTNETVEQSVRLRDGKTSVLAGFLQGQKMVTLSGLPGITGLPGVGYLGSSTNSSDQSTQLLILVTPRIIRAAPHASKALYAGHGLSAAGSGGGGATAEAPPAPEPQPEPTQPAEQQNPPPQNPFPPGRPGFGQPIPQQQPVQQPPQ